MVSAVSRAITRRWKIQHKMERAKLAAELSEGEPDGKIETERLTVPYKYKPRPYQLPVLKAMDSGYKRAVCVWHRRAGKDKTFLNYMIKRMVERVGQYYYWFPFAQQGRKALWEGIDRDGFRYLEHFPRQLRKRVNNQDMSLELVNGSIFRVLGTDRLEVVGPNPVGCVFSEYSLQHPKGWSYVRPILAENDGWAMFNFTPRGHNHAFRLYRMAQGNPDWFCELLTADDTGAITPESIQAERGAGMSEEMVQQEFYCSFERGMESSYYGKVLGILYEQGRIRPDIKLNAGLPVYTVCDPGFHWATWIFQKVGTDIVFLDSFEDIGQGVEFHAEKLKRIGKARGYRYCRHYAPVDTENNSAYKAVAGKSLLEHAAENDLHLTVLKPEYRVKDGIERTRQFLYRCWFNSSTEGCELGLDALEDYQVQRVERLSTEDRGFYHDRPADNWSVHLADAMRYASMAVRQLPTGAVKAEEQEEYRTPWEITV